MRYVTRKIVAAACQIARGKAVRLELGRIDIVRDWGWAPEYVEAMWRMLQREKPCDYVIATGESNSLQSFVEAVFGEVGLDWREHVDIVSSLCRPTDLTYSRGNPERALRELSWHPKLRMRAVVKEMVRAELEQIDAES
jgi:GDPmannose 4,6-dehydratase